MTQLKCLHKKLGIQFTAFLYFGADVAHYIRQVAPIEGAIPEYIFNHDAKFAPNIIQICLK